MLMAAPGPEPLVKLICGMLSTAPRLLEQVRERLGELFGPLDQTSETTTFDFTDYYDQSMGCPLYRQFVSFAQLMSAGDLAAAKLATNDLEDRVAAECAEVDPESPPRPINLDPGYVAEPKLVLASMKDGPQRVYLSDGVFGEVTLLYRRGRWQPLEWTFPDYASGRYDAFLTSVRDSLREQIKERRE